MRSWILFALVVALGFGVVSVRSDAQVDPTTPESMLALQSIDDCWVLGNILNETSVRSFAEPRLVSGPCIGTLRSAPGFPFYTGKLQSTSQNPGQPETLHVRYIQRVSPPVVDRLGDSMYVSQSGNSADLVGNPIVIFDQRSYDFLVLVLSSLPAEVADLFADGYELQRIAATPSAPFFGTISFGASYTVYLRFSDGLDSKFIAITAASTGSSFGPLYQYP